MNRILKWRATGFQDETPFGLQSKEKRERERVQAPERSKRREHSKPNGYNSRQTRRSRHFQEGDRGTPLMVYITNIVLKCRISDHANEGMGANYVSAGLGYYRIGGPQ